MYYIIGQEFGWCKAGIVDINTDRAAAQRACERMQAQTPGGTFRVVDESEAVGLGLLPLSGPVDLADDGTAIDHFAAYR